MSNSPGILIVDRDTIAAQALKQVLAAEGYTAHHALSVETGLKQLQVLQAKTADEAVGVVLIDQDVAGVRMEHMRQLHDDWPMLVSIVTSAFRKVESAVSAMRLGAADYLLKPIPNAELLNAVQRAMQRHLLILEHELAQQETAKMSVPHNRRKTDQASIDDGYPMPLSEAMKTPERNILLAALQANDWNRGKTAKQLDINRTTLYKKIRQHRLDEPS